MTAHEYFAALLRQQLLPPADDTKLRLLRDQVQGEVGKLAGSPRFYYAGSYAKGTLIRERFDLDIVAYWPSTTTYNLSGISDAVGTQLKKGWQYVNPKTVSWELPFEGGFHIDVVPGRAIDTSYYYANLYRRDTGTWLQTSIKAHIDSVRGSGRQDVIRLAKLWKLRKGLRMKSFVLEQLVIRGASGTRFDNLENQFVAVLKFLSANATTARVEDPANSGNVLSNDVSLIDKQNLAAAAQWALNVTSWSSVFAP
jgi:hypothetical protein